MRDVELLIPASNLEVLKVAVLYGADAVYIGGEMYGLRAKAKNFSMEDVKEGITFTVLEANGGTILSPPYLRVKSHSLPEPR